MKGRLCRFVISAVLLTLFLSACSPQMSKSVTVASKQFTENILLSEMYAQLIEHHTDLKVIRKQNLGTTAVCYTAMTNEEVDIYVEYTGTIYNEILGYDSSDILESETLNEFVKNEMAARGVTVYDVIGLNNTYALAMLRAKAEDLNIIRISDLQSAAPDLIFAANDLFYARTHDGYDSMTGKYGLHFKSVVKMNNSLLYGAVADGQVDVVVAYATDSRLPDYDMIILEDDGRLFPDYHALPIIRSSVLDKYPELNDVLNLLSDRIDNQEMRELNYAVDIENANIEELAASFLTENGLINQ